MKLTIFYLHRFARPSNVLALLVPGFLLLAGFSSKAEDEPHPIDLAMEEAMDRNPSTAGQTEAIDEALKQWDAELNRHYQTLRKRLDPAASDSLRDSQRAWITWRDKELESLRAFYSQMEGTMWVPASAYAEMNLTRERALALGRLAELSEMRAHQGADPGASWLDREHLGGLRLGQEAAEVLQQIEGGPAKGKNEFWGATGEWVQTWAWRSQGLELDMASTTEHGGKQVASVTVTASSTLRTARGAGIGTAEVEVRRLYADVANKEDSDREKAFVAGSVFGGLIFRFEKGRVSQIFLGAAAE